MRMPEYNCNIMATFSDEKYIRNALRTFEYDFKHRNLTATYRGSPIRRHITAPHQCLRDYPYTLELITYKKRRFVMFVNGSPLYEGRLADFSASVAYSLLP